MTFLTIFATIVVIGTLIGITADLLAERKRKQAELNRVADLATTAKIARELRRFHK